MQSPISSESGSFARQACASCKTAKRKCDKELPKCSLCLKKGFTCDYSRSADATHAAPSWPFLAPTEQNDATVCDTLDLPTLSFLDPTMLQHGQLELSRRSIGVPSQIAGLLGDVADIRTAAAVFFETIHTWMPMISKKRFYDQHIKHVLHSHPEISLLFLCMKLVTEVPPSDPRILLYHAAKHFYLEVEIAGICTIQVLQAGILIALYEIGHAIYPAAFLSIGDCARFAYTLGIQGAGPKSASNVTTLVELEERRRVWWSIVILDRFVNIGCPKRPLSTDDPQLNDLLPTHDASWDEGVVTSIDTFTLGASPLNDHMSKFAWLCQAARLLGLVLNHVVCDKMPPKVREDTEIQLSRTIFAMIKASRDLENPNYDPIAFCYCALIILHEPSLSPSEKNPNQRRRAEAAMDEIFGNTTKNLDKKIPSLVADLDKASPWGLHLAYRAYINSMQKTSERTMSEDKEELQWLHQALVVMDGRWKVAGTYLKLIEAREVMGIS